MEENQKASKLQSILNGAFRYDLFPWLKDLSLGYKAGLLLAILHFVLFISNTLYMINHNDGRWHMFWILCGYTDFPASLLLTKVILPLFFPGNPFMSRNPLTWMTFVTFYAVVGTAWYFFLPVLIEKAVKKITTTTWAASGAVTMMIIPIFAHWLQLLRFVTGWSHIFAPRLYSILPAVWTALLVWLFFAAGRRKAVLWLLVLAPFVYYYFVRDLYYYITLIRH